MTWERDVAILKLILTAGDRAPTATMPAVISPAVHHFHVLLRNVQATFQARPADRSCLPLSFLEPRVRFGQGVKTLVKMTVRFLTVGGQQSIQDGRETRKAEMAESCNSKCGTSPE
jgi:hypothetical protein